MLELVVSKQFYSTLIASCFEDSGDEGQVILGVVDEDIYILGAYLAANQIKKQV